eukprot:366279-Chlamydomonas_euryale.AAC.4
MDLTWVLPWQTPRGRSSGGAALRTRRFPGTDTARRHGYTAGFRSAEAAGKTGGPGLLCGAGKSWDARRRGLGAPDTRRRPRCTADRMPCGIARRSALRRRPARTGTAPVSRRPAARVCARRRRWRERGAATPAYAVRGEKMRHGASDQASVSVACRRASKTAQSRCDQCPLRERAAARAAPRCAARVLAHHVHGEDERERAHWRRGPRSCFGVIARYPIGSCAGKSGAAGKGSLGVASARRPVIGFQRRERRRARCHGGRHNSRAQSSGGREERCGLIWNVARRCWRASPDSTDVRLHKGHDDSGGELSRMRCVVDRIGSALQRRPVEARRTSGACAARVPGRATRMEETPEGRAGDGMGERQLGAFPLGSTSYVPDASDTCAETNARSAPLLSSQIPRIPWRLIIVYITIHCVRRRESAKVEGERSSEKERSRQCSP